jgi:phosphoribosyl-dephospho-CoA transferase
MGDGYYERGECTVCGQDGSSCQCGRDGQIEFLRERIAELRAERDALVERVREMEKERRR